MKINCPKCRSLIPPANVNVATDVAMCPACNEAFPISTLVGGKDKPTEGFDIQSPPPGAWFEDFDTSWRLGATTRSWGAIFFVPFTCVWAGGSLGGIYGMQIWNGEFNLLLSLFGIPFLLGSLVLISLCLMTLFGKVEVIVDGDDGRVFQGVGSIGWTRRFDWSSITAVEERNWGSYENNTNYYLVIALVGKTRVIIASMATEARRYYLLQGLRTLLGRRNASRS